MYKHFIRLSENKEITQAFTDWHAEPIEGDVLISENEIRHVTEAFPILQNLYDTTANVYRLKYVDKEIVEKTHEEIYTPEFVKAKALEKCLQSRKQAYVETDAFKNECEYDGIDLKVWKDRVKEIKLKYPKPV